eukprot:GSChrysophyteH1.ASY1.ANO1.1850.1 assembled CDS
MDSADSETQGSSLEQRMEMWSEMRSQRKLMTQEFLEPLIGSGEERAQYQKILAETSEVLVNDDRMWEDHEDAYEEWDEMMEDSQGYGIEGKASSPAKYDDSFDAELGEDEA